MAEEREINGNKQFRYACPIGEITVKEYFLKLNQLEWAASLIYSQNSREDALRFRKGLA